MQVESLQDALHSTEDMLQSVRQHVESQMADISKQLATLLEQHKQVQQDRDTLQLKYRKASKALTQAENDNSGLQAEIVRLNKEVWGPCM